MRTRFPAAFKQTWYIAVKVILGFLILMFLAGILLRKSPPKQRWLVMLLLSGLIAFAYYFLHQI
jgi:hypothetical protein